jgi:hypothetical protein
MRYLALGDPRTRFTPAAYEAAKNIDVNSSAIAFKAQRRWTDVDHYHLAERRDNMTVDQAG